MSEKPARFKIISTPGKKFGCFTVLLALALPVCLWSVLLIMDATKNYCSECSVGWSAVGTTVLAVPLCMIGLLIWAVAESRERSRKNHDD